MQNLAAHGSPDRGRRPPRGRGWWLLSALLVALVVTAALVGSFLTRNSSRQLRGGHPGVQSHSAGDPGAPSSPSGGTFKVVGIDPPSGTNGVASDATVTVRFSGPLRSGGPRPSLDPPVAGSWVPAGRSALTFQPSAPFVPGSTETLSIPGGPGGLRDQTGGSLPGSTSATFTVAPGTTLRLQELLAALGYLPVSFTQQGSQPPPQQLAMDQPGTFAWRWSTFPADLLALWIQGSPNVITQGAVMTFESQHGLTVDGLAGPQVWSALLRAAATSALNQAPWDYAYVSKNLPETLTVYINGNPQFANIPVNTGAPGADTTDGTFPVFEHVPSSEMKGTNPDGTTYDDPNVPWASYFNGGDALHGFVRAQYGFPQSNGCVEMPIAEAQVTWPYTPIGTLVTVVGPPVT